ncbi:MAG: ABC transporter ATP-binding protein [bacterium]
MGELAVVVKNLSKRFRIPQEKQDKLKDKFINPFKRIPKNEFLALNDVSFEVKKGEFVGIIGRNGSGKSTLLKILSGVYEPTQGSIWTDGSIVPFLELGVGFNPELTGRENIILNGVILGMTKKYMEEKTEEIIDFAELREFIDLQVKNYSSGMVIRLAFSVAAQVKADIYLLDEVLSVGDAGFQKKSLQKMEELMENGATILFVSHSMEEVKKRADRVIYLEKGKKIFEGNAIEATKQYQLSFIESEEEKKKFLRKERLKEIEIEFQKKKEILNEEIRDKSEFEKIIALEVLRLSLLNEDDSDLYLVQKNKVNELKKMFSKQIYNLGEKKIILNEILSVNKKIQISGITEVPGISLKDIVMEAYFSWLISDETNKCWNVIINPTFNSQASSVVLFVGKDQERVWSGTIQPGQTEVIEIIDASNGPIKILSTNKVGFYAYQQIIFKGAFEKIVALSKFDESNEFIFSYDELNYEKIQSWIMIINPTYNQKPLEVEIIKNSKVLMEITINPGEVANPYFESVYSGEVIVKSKNDLKFLCTRRTTNKD